MILLAADRDIEAAVTGILERYRRNRGVRITYQSHTHFHRDPGVFLRAQEFLRPFHLLYRYALVVFDIDGCGARTRDRQQIENKVEARLSTNGWPERAAVIAIDPELENWVWSRSPVVSEILGWRERTSDIWEWLQEEGLISGKAAKPNDPKAAYERALRIA
jgi:hypothetical protein